MLCHFEIIMEAMLNAWDLRSLIWKRDITDAETYTSASL